jgi:hypothetical protein
MFLMASEDLIRDALKQPAKPVPSKEVEYDDLPKKRKPRQVPNEIEKWVPGHFVAYARRLYVQRYGKDWDVQFRSQCGEILLLKDMLIDNFGFCDNKVLRDFIKWYFDNHADSSMTHHSLFSMRNLRKDWVIKAFADQYNYNAVTAPVPPPVAKKPKDNDFFDPERMSAAFLLDDEQFVTDYGVIFCLAWLVNKKGYSAKDAAKWVFIVCERLHKRGHFAKVRAATEQFNPYPPDAVALTADKLAKRLDPSLTITVETEAGAWSNLPWVKKV